jgi:hypothetical protein
MKRMIFCFILISITASCMAQKNKGFSIVERKEQKQLDVLYNGNLLTAYCYYDSIMKPFLFPVNTIDGITVTRGWPLQPRSGERTDHPHHTGIWQNYESVNGLDFWNNSTAIAPEKRNLYGTIRHEGIITRKTDKDRAELVTSADWIRPDGHVLIREKTSYVFTVKDENFIIDRKTVYNAQDLDVVFKDVKDGFLAIRVARELEMPSDQADVFTDVHGNKTSVEKMKNNAGVTGKYYSSENLMGDSVWGTKGRWCMLKGKKNGKDITIGIFDHPSNIGYPAYWHARGYGLFAINPFGRKIFSNGKEELNFILKANTSVNFNYRILIASKDLSADKMNKMADAFAAQ